MGINRKKEKCSKKTCIKSVSSNSELLESFIEYCHEYPEQRFWQALRNWADTPFLMISDGKDQYDTFYSTKQSGR